MATVLLVAAQGTTDGLKLAVNVGAMLIAFIALVSLINAGFGLIEVGGAPMTLERLFGWVLSPIAFLMGFAWAAAQQVGGVLATRTILNEVIAFASSIWCPASSASGLGPSPPPRCAGSRMCRASAFRSAGWEPSRRAVSRTSPSSGSVAGRRDPRQLHDRACGRRRGRAAARAAVLFEPLTALRLGSRRSCYAGAAMHAISNGLSYEQYLALAESSNELLEYHDGVAVAMVAPSLTHARILGRLNAELVVWLRARASTCLVYNAGLKIRVESTNRTLLPDLTVVCGPTERSEVDPQAVSNPRVVLEVLSPGTEDYDLGRKAQQYRRIASLREYVMVAQDRRFASIYRRAGDLWVLQDVEADGLLKLESLEFELPLAAFYSDANGVIVD